jgi:hypothetical protein
MHLDLADSSRIADRQGVAIVLLDMIVIVGRSNVVQYPTHDGMNSRQAAFRASRSSSSPPKQLSSR